MLENGKCPSCGGALLLDSSKEKVVCKYCGHELVIQEAIQKVVVDGIATFDSLLLAAQQAFDYDEDFDKALKTYKEALKLRPDDYRVLWGLFLCEMQSIMFWYTRKGYVQFEGDIDSCIKEAIIKYGEKAILYAPEETKLYYREMIEKYKNIFKSTPKHKEKNTSFNWVLFVILLIVFWPCAIIYLIVKKVS